MKESLSYQLLITMKKRNRLKQNAVDRGKSFETDNSYHYDGAGKRLSDLCNYGYAERKGDDHNGYMLYQVSDKGLCIKSMEEYAQAVYKPRTPKPKKTREESAVKKESRVSGPSEEEMREMFTKLCNKYEKDGVSKEDIAIRFGVPLSYNGIISTCIKEMIDKDSPRSPPVGYTAGTQTTTSHRNEEGDIVIGYKVNTQVTEEEYKAKETREQEERERLHRVLGKKLQPRYKRLRSAFTGK